MTALKIVVACVSIAALGMVLALPFAVHAAAGYVCLAAGIVGALGAISASFRRAMDRVGRWIERHTGLISIPMALAAMVTALLSLLGLHDVAGLLLAVFGLGLAWSLLTGWLCYKVVETLVGPPVVA